MRRRGPRRRTRLGLPFVFWLKLAREIVRCNLGGLFPELIARLPVAPLYANFWLTSKCSGRCRTCRQWREPFSGEMDTAAAKDALLRLRRRGIWIVYFVGGDVFLRSDLFELISFASRLGMRIHLTVNAFTLSEDIARALMSAPIASLHLSLDSMTEDLDEIRGVPDAASKVRRALDLLERYRHPRVELGLTATVMKRTLGGMRDVVRLALDRGCVVFFNLINFTHRFFDTDFSRSEYKLSAADRQELASLTRWLAEERRRRPRLLPRLVHLEWMAGYFEDHRRRDTPCYQALLKICLQAGGDIGPCCSMETIGNLHRQDLRVLFRSRRYAELLRRALTKSCPGCSCRYTLSLDVSLVSRMRDLLLGWRLLPIAEGGPG